MPKETYILNWKQEDGEAIRCDATNSGAIWWPLNGDLKVSAGLAGAWTDGSNINKVTQVLEAIVVHA